MSVSHKNRVICTKSTYYIIPPAFLRSQFHLRETAEFRAYSNIPTLHKETNKEETTFLALHPYPHTAPTKFDIDKTFINCTKAYMF